MNETKKRGRPANAEREARAGNPDRERAQAYALRVFAGCSISLQPHEKLKIVKEALDGQGLSMEGVTLPD